MVEKTVTAFIDIQFKKEIHKNISEKKEKGIYIKVEEQNYDLKK